MNAVADTLRSTRFRAEREAGWRRLEAILAQAERKGLRSLSFAEARDLATLYQQAVNALSVAREISLDRALLDYLEALTARACLAVYAPQETLAGLVGRFVRSAPQAMRRSWPHLLLSFLVMALGTTIGWLLYFENADWYYIFVPTGGLDVRSPSATAEDLRSVIYGQDDEPLSSLGAFASFLFSHNTRIAIFCFALGALAGLPTLLLSLQNGTMLGAFVALHAERDLLPDIFGWLSIHGVTELSAIAVAGAGGYRLAGAVLFPGRFSRADALRHEGRDAVKLALVAALMLLVAAVLEGFGRQLVQDTTTRIVIGWGVGALWLAWFLLGGRQRA